MGYEVKVIIGRKCPLDGFDGDKGNYFLRSAQIDLGKIGYESSIISLASEAESTYDACQVTGNPSRYDKVYWSDLFKIRQEKILETIKEEDEDLLLRLGGEEKAEELIEDISKYAESWETETLEDCYGSKFIAIPLDEMLEAVIKNQEEWVEEMEEPYYKFDLLKEIITSFKKNGSYVNEEGNEVCNYYCVVYGY